MQQLTKPMTIKGELVLNLQVSNQDIKHIHEALTFYLRSKSTKNNESTYLGIQDLREEIYTLRKILNPS